MSLVSSDHEPKLVKRKEDLSDFVIDQNTPLEQLAADLIYHYVGEARATETSRGDAQEMQAHYYNHTILNIPSFFIVQYLNNSVPREFVLRAYFSFEAMLAEQVEQDTIIVEQKTKDDIIER